MGFEKKWPFVVMLVSMTMGPVLWVATYAFQSLPAVPLQSLRSRFNRLKPFSCW